MTVAVLAPGTRVGDFRIDALLAVGGMGQVYRAHQEGLDRVVALKVLPSALGADAEFLSRFRREAAVMRDLDHPAILPIYAAGDDDGRVYLAMRLVPGPNLADVLAAGRLSPERTRAAVRAVGEALDHAHGRGIVHRDVKPSNILVDDDGRVFLADFGIAKDSDSSLTTTGRYLGTPRYMAPEQATGHTGYRADLYALGCVAFHALTGRPPYEGDDAVALLLAHASGPVPRASAAQPALPAAVDRVLAKAMAKRPEDRYPSGRLFADDLEAALAAAPGRRRRVLLPVLGVGLVALAVGSAALVAAPAAAPPVPAAAPVPAPQAPPPLAFADVKRGDLLFEAPMDGTPTGFVDTPATRPDRAVEDIRYVPGALELEAWGEDADTWSELDVDPGLTTYVGEMDLVFRPGSEMELCWSLRWALPRELANYLCLRPVPSTATLSVYRPSTGQVPLGDPVTVPALAEGRRVALGVVVGQRRLQLYVDGRLVLDVDNPDVKPAGTVPGIEMQKVKGPGMVRIEGVRAYELVS